MSRMTPDLAPLVAWVPIVRCPPMPDCPFGGGRRYPAGRAEPGSAVIVPPESVEQHHVDDVAGVLKGLLCVALTDFDVFAQARVVEVPPSGRRLPGLKLEADDAPTVVVVHRRREVRG